MRCYYSLREAAWQKVPLTLIRCHCVQGLHETYLAGIAIKHTPGRSGTIHVHDDSRFYGSFFIVTSLGICFTPCSDT